MRIQTHTLLSSQGCPFEASSAMGAAIKHGPLCCSTITKYLPPAQNGVHFRSPTHHNSSGFPPGPANCFNFGWSVVARVFYPQQLLWTARCIAPCPFPKFFVNWFKLSFNFPLHHIPACPAVCVDPQHTPHLQAALQAALAALHMWVSLAGFLRVKGFECNP